MSDTPTTDAAVLRYDGGDEPNSFDYVEPDFARDLERSLRTALALLDEINPPSGPFWSGAPKQERIRKLLAGGSS